MERLPPWLVIIVALLALILIWFGGDIAKLLLSNESKPLNSTPGRMGRGREAGIDPTSGLRMDQERQGLDRECELFGRKLESESIDVVHALRTNTHCHLKVGAADEVSQARRILCDLSSGTLQSAHRGGLDSFSVFYLDEFGPGDAHTRFDAEINREGLCIASSQMIEWSQYVQKVNAR